MSNVGNIIKEHRIRAGFTQNTLAAALHVTDKAISKWERGICLPDVTLMPKLSLLLDVDLEFFISKEGIGLGDVKLMISVAFYLGLELFLRALFFISLISALFSLILLAVKQATKNTALPFAPFIFAGTCVATFLEVIK